MTESSFEKIIKKAIEGNWKPRGVDFKEWSSLGGVISLVAPKEIVCDPFFWQALGKVCMWTKELKSKSGIWSDGLRFGTWLYYGRKFHEINLAQSWQAAIEYLLSVIEK